MKLRVNTTLDYDLKEKAKDNTIELGRALEFGVIFKLAERNVCMHPHNTLTNKISKIAERLEATLRELENAREEIKEIKKRTVLNAINI